jgi:hypothetical protein
MPTMSIRRAIVWTVAASVVGCWTLRTFTGSRRRRRLRRAADARRLDVERRADSDAAVKSDAAAHLFHQRLGDRQTQTRAGKTSVGRSLGLGEFLENTRSKIFGDTDAMILDFEAHRLAGGHRMQAHRRARGRKLRAVR